MLDQGPGARAVELPGLDLLHQARARPRQHLDVAAKLVEQGGKAGALQRAHGGEDADGPVACCRRGRFHCRFHADDRDAERLAQQRHGGGRSGVARHHDDVGAMLDEEMRQHAGALLDEVRAAGTVGHPGRIGHVVQGCRGQGVADFTQYGQAAEPRVEYAYAQVSLPLNPTKLLCAAERRKRGAGARRGPAAGPRPCL